VGRKSHYEINVFLQNTLATIIGTPRFFTSKISLKYIPINIYLFSSPGGLEKHEIVQLLIFVSQEYKYEERQGQIPLFIHHNE